MAEIYDVIVVGGGNAALCAALEARGAGRSVLLLERSTEHMRGGNTRHTRNIRCSHAEADQFFSGPYSEEEHLKDLISVTGGPQNLDLAKMAIRDSSTLPAWMSKHGVHWQQPLAGTLHLGRTNRWFLGGGKALLNTYYLTAKRMGIAVRYNAMVEDLIIENGKFEAVRLKNETGGELIRARAVVIAAGGYEANIEWLKKHWGDAAENFIIRGTPYNDGTMLAALMKHGAKSIGDPKGFHAIAVDARAPKFDGGIVTRLDVVPFGIVVNRDARRFYDEGEDIWPKRYAIWGTLIAGQPGQIAYGVVDAKAIDRFLPPMFKPFQADTLEALAPQLGLDPAYICGNGHRIQSIGGRQHGPAHGQAGWKQHARAHSAEEQLGHAHRQATVLRAAAAAGHHLHLHGRGGGRLRARRRSKWKTIPKYFRRGRNHVRKHSHQGLSGRLWPDHRLGVRQAGGQRGGGQCPVLIFLRKPTGS